MSDTPTPSPNKMTPDTSPFLPPRWLKPAPKEHCLKKPFMTPAPRAYSRIKIYGPT